uniref:DUF4926 domain-containing protein n=1 Tax=Candidatus Kentrum sp. LFY TaxID=2126342 RepID=A0A450WEH3_9GAMM|nr:MAG: protein of unknown function (DUF4926) [Candidatus Kentron sp. LFY]
MFEELSTVILNRDLAEHGLIANDVGTIVHTYRDGSACEVEFMTGAGRTIAVVQVAASDLRLMREHDILHVRKLAA